MVVLPFAELVPLLVRLLYPKMRKRSGRLGGRGAPGSARAAILNYLAALDSSELAPLVHLFLQPISSAFRQSPSHVQDSVSPGDRWLSRLLHACCVHVLPALGAVLCMYSLLCVAPLLIANLHWHTS